MHRYGGKVERVEQKFMKWLRTQALQLSSIEELQAPLEGFVDTYNHDATGRPRLQAASLVTCQPLMHRLARHPEPGRRVVCPRQGSNLRPIA